MYAPFDLRFAAINPPACIARLEAFGQLAQKQVPFSDYPANHCATTTASQGYVPALNSSERSRL
jgi:hypothetical protein